MPASSEKQLHFMQLVKAYKAGHHTVLKGVSKGTAADIKAAAKGMTGKQVNDFVQHPVTKT